MRSRNFINHDGVELAGWETGAGPTIVLLHAGGERSAVWKPVARALSSRHGLHCVAIDQRGHGASGGIAERIADFGDDLRHVLCRLSGPCVVVGASLGGFAAIDALRFPDARASTAGIVLVDVVPDPDPERVRQFLTSIGMHETHHQLIDDILAAGPQLLEQLCGAKVPTHLVRALGSQVSQDEIKRLQLSVAKLGITSVDTGHLVAREAPEELAAIIGPIATNWLDRSPT